MAEQQEKKKLVMIAIDGSEYSEHAFNYFVEHLLCPEHSMLLIHCAELPAISAGPSFYCENLHRAENEMLLIHNGELPVISSGYPMYSSGDLWQQLLEKEKEKVRELEERYAEKMRERNMKGKIKALFASKPGETIVSEANENKVTMIVMGTRGLGKIRRTVMGSVSDYVVHHAHCPVIVCRK